MRPILISMVNQFADLTGGMARYLRDGHGINTVLLHSNPLPDPKTYDLTLNYFAETINYGTLLRPRPLEILPSPTELASAAEKAERRYNIRILEIIRTDRHLGQYFTNGAKTPRSNYGSQFTHEQAVDLVLRLFIYFEELIDRLAPSIVVSIPADAARMVLANVAEKHGIPARQLTQNYANNAFQWRVNRFNWPGGLVQAFKREAATAKSDAEGDRSGILVPDTNRTSYARHSMLAGQSYTALLRNLSSDLRRLVGNVVKRRTLAYGGYAQGDSLASNIAIWREKRRLARTRPLMNRFRNDQPYVFYPLVVEPETTLQGESPMADNQLIVIDWLSKTLPGGWRLIVKEHPGFTYPRPDFFWEQITRYPNVDIAAIYESGEQIAQDARIIAIINSTLGMQAAAGGIPVLTFNPNWWGRLLPHVIYAGSYAETAEGLRTLARDDNLPPIAERQHLGRALERALNVNSIPLEDSRLLAEKALGEPTPLNDVRAIVEALLASLDGVASEGTILFS